MQKDRRSAPTFIPTTSLAAFLSASVHCVFCYAYSIFPSSFVSTSKQLSRTLSPLFPSTSPPRQGARETHKPGALKPPTLNALSHSPLSPPPRRLHANWILFFPSASPCHLTLGSSFTPTSQGQNPPSPYGLPQKTTFPPYPFSYPSAYTTPCPPRLC